MLAQVARAADRMDELSRDRLRHHGASIPLFPGVEGLFEASNVFGQVNGLRISHFIVPSGPKEMIMGTGIARHFAKVFACRYHYDAASREVTWPCVAVNYTTKTQFLFRINKGVGNSWDDMAVNRFIEPGARPFPFSRMIYLGDGDTDIPSMKLVKQQGGCSLAVFNPQKWSQPVTQDRIEKLIAEDRVSYVVPGDYSRGLQLDVTVRGVLRLFGRRAG